jgi:hypothetical protein
MDIQATVLNQVHSRVYEILAYISLIHNEALSEKTFESIVRIEKLCKSLLIELKEAVNDNYNIEKI